MEKSASSPTQYKDEKKENIENITNFLPCFHERFIWIASVAPTVGPLPHWSCINNSSQGRNLKSTIYEKLYLSVLKHLSNPNLPVNVNDEN